MLFYPNPNPDPHCWFNVFVNLFSSTDFHRKCITCTCNKRLTDLWPMTVQHVFNQAQMQMDSQFKIFLPAQVCIWSLFFFLFLKFCMNNNAVLTKSSRKAFPRKLLFIFLSSKCKRNASVFQLSKPQNTIFLIQTEQKHIPVWSYI